MNFDSAPLYAGLANVKLAVDPFELGEGLVLSGTYGCLMSTLAMAFARPTRERPYGEPWAAVQGGFQIEIGVQLYIPPDFQRKEWFDRLNAIWWIAALMRIRSIPAIVVPVISDRPFGAIPEHWQEANLHSIEASRQRILPDDATHCMLTENDLIWIREYWLAGGTLMHKHRELKTSFLAFDYAASSGSVALALISLWGALEELFSPAKQELRFRVSSSIASFLETAGEARWILRKSILKLYDARSKVAHGTGGREMEPFRETYHLMRRVLIKILEENHVPSRAEVEKKLFGCDP